jgi:hypothetical protein
MCYRVYKKKTEFAESKVELLTDHERLINPNDVLTKKEKFHTIHQRF